MASPMPDPVRPEVQHALTANRWHFPDKAPSNVPDAQVTRRVPVAP